MLRSKLGVKLSTIVGVVLTVLLAMELTWLVQSERKYAVRQVEQSTEQSALALEASLKSIMLSGEGPIAHDWLKRVRQTTDFDDVRIYRRDGTEAFVDNATIDHVNAWLGRKRFEHHNRNVKSETIPSSSLKLFTMAAAGTETRIVENGHLTLLLPIRIENACLQCHGYDGTPVNPVRGVLRLSVPMGAQISAIDHQRKEILGSEIAVILLMALILTWLLKREVIRPIGLLEAGAKRIEEGDSSHRVKLDRTDELGSLANIFNELVNHLQEQTNRQTSISEAIIGLSRELVDDVVLRRIGELAMQLTGARYAMLSYLKDGEKQFIPLGMGDSEIEKLKAHPPQGLGLLGLLWVERQVVRINRIDTHPRSIGFPEGHPAMTAFLGAPIEFAGQMIGALYLTDKENGQAFSDDDESVVRMLASSCAVALSNAQQFERLHEANAELEVSQARYKAIVYNVMDGIITINESGQIVGINPAAERMFGYPQQDAIGQDVTILMTEPYRSEHSGYINRYLETRESHIVGVRGREVPAIRRNGEQFPMELSASEMILGGQRYFVGIVRDITERKLAEEKIAHLAHHDYLTGLPNRTLFLECLAQSIALAKRNSYMAAILFLDLDGFKAINDNLGHDVGDMLLKDVAKRLSRNVRASDTLARFGGDEFVIVLNNASGRSEVSEVAIRIIEDIAKPFNLNGRLCQIGCSIGLAFIQITLRIWLISSRRPTTQCICRSDKEKASIVFGVLKMKLHPVCVARRSDWIIFW